MEHKKPSHHPLVACADAAALSQSVSPLQCCCQENVVPGQWWTDTDSGGQTVIWKLCGTCLTCEDWLDSLAWPWGRWRTVAPETLGQAPMVSVPVSLCLRWLGNLCVCVSPLRCLPPGYKIHESDEKGPEIKDGGGLVWERLQGVGQGTMAAGWLPVPGWRCDGVLTQTGRETSVPFF